MKVLYVLSQVQITGAETYALTLASALRELGHDVIFVSDSLRSAGEFKFYPLSIHERNRSIPGRIKNVFALKNIIEKEKIDLIHSHSRAANLVSHLALVRFHHQRIPLVVTVHGRWRNHLAFRWFPCLGSRTIVVCPHLQTYLHKEIGVPAEGISMIPNGIDTDTFAPSSSQNNEGQELLFVGRFSGQKGKVVRYLLETVLKEAARRLSKVRLKILAVAQGWQDRAVVQAINIQSRREVVEVLNGNQDLTGLYNGAALVIGSGRVALEALSCGRMVVAIGESSAPGLLTDENFDSAFDSNFGDCGEWNLFERQTHVLSDIEKALSDRKLGRSLRVWGRNKVLSNFDSKKIALEVQGIYRNLLSHPTG